MTAREADSRFASEKLGDCCTIASHAPWRPLGPRRAFPAGRPDRHWLKAVEVYESRADAERLVREKIGAHVKIRPYAMIRAMADSVL
jgi:hypothetical protein